MVLVPTDSAIGDGLGIVYTMVNGLDRAQIGKDCLQIVVRHVPEKPPRHDWTELPRAHFARVHHS